jgi:hypothetical protein
MTGSKRAADAASDGYTFVLGTVGTHAQGQSLYKKPLYNAAIERDTRISCSVCAERDREMDGPDQGKRGDCGVSRTFFAGLVRETTE